LEVDDFWWYWRIVLKFINLVYALIVLDEKAENTVGVIAEVIEVLGTLPPL